MKTKRYIIAAAVILAIALAALGVFVRWSYLNSERQVIKEYFNYLYGEERAAELLDGKSWLLLSSRTGRDSGGEREFYSVETMLVPRQRPKLHTDDMYTLTLDKEEYAPGESIKIEISNNTELDRQYMDIIVDYKLKDTWYTVFPGFPKKKFRETICNAGESVSHELTPSSLRVYPEGGEDITLWPGEYRVTVMMDGKNLCAEFRVSGEKAAVSSFRGKVKADETGEYLAEVYGANAVAHVDGSDIYLVVTELYNRGDGGWWITRTGGTNIIPVQEPELYAGDAYTLALDKSVYAPGDTLRLELSSSGNRAVVCGDPLIDWYNGEKWYTVFPGFRELQRTLQPGSAVSMDINPYVLRRYPTKVTLSGDGDLPHIESEYDPLNLRPGKYRLRIAVDGEVLCEEFTVE